AQRAHLATHNPDGTIHLVPLTFAVENGDVVVWTPRASRKVANLRRDATATVLVELGANYAEFRAAQIYGTAEVVDDADALRAAEVAASLETSRTPVREALLLLEAEGLVVSSHNRGFRVRPLTPQHISELYDLRAHLESFAARKAAENVASGVAIGLGHLDD